VLTHSDTVLITDDVLSRYCYFKGSLGITQDWSTAHLLERRYQKRHRELWSHIGRALSPTDRQTRI